MPGPLVMWFEDGRTFYGFKTAEQAAAFTVWSQTSGIDWSVSPHDQPIETWPPAPPEMIQDLQPSARRAPNLHTVACSGQPLGVECVCGRRTLLAHDKIDAFKGNMKELPRAEEADEVPELRQAAEGTHDIQRRLPGACFRARARPAGAAVLTFSRTARHPFSARVAELGSLRYGGPFTSSVTICSMTNCVGQSQLVKTRLQWRQRSR